MNILSLRRALSWKGLGLLYMLACYGFIFLPVIVLVLFSFQDGRLPVPPFHGPTLFWYGEVLANSRLVAAMGNSFLVGVGSSLLSLVLGFLAAYGLARYRLRGRSLIRGFLVLPMAVSYLIVGMGLLVMASWAHIAPSLWLVGISHVVINMPLAFALCAAQFSETQARIEMAAGDLGASLPRILLQVTVPMMAPTLIAAFILCFTLSWDEFLSAFLLSRFEITLPVAIWGILRGGLNPQTNAIGSLVFFGVVALALIAEALLFRKKKNSA
ncbi:spermidine/putrescine ABC transporter permease [Acetobacter estunensis NRIC 0472]|uniref:ABC transporter permease subunit n=1 Tax=Acetobacter estunensis TaxID=104097 RepID=A0A967BA12_9PROT|nr:ABC transporter permease [Acetobacter estunensis]NHO54911.1 ABC transporter permease subunit [Acetobacter estunensis]GBQ23979.1 spermidine/putrescine ABC transporter permease [Acetobacter estunensis NRIC 0472]